MSHISESPMLPCLTAGDRNFHHLVKMVSVRFLHCIATIFLFVIRNFRTGRYFETMQRVCFLLNFCPLVLASIGVPCLHDFCGVLTVIFLFPPSLLFTCIDWISSVRRYHSLSPIYVFIALLIYISVD